MSPMRAPELLAERYKFARSINAGASTLAWLASDQRYGRQVVACALGEVRLKALERAVGVEQIYLATLLDLIRDPAPEAIPGEEPVKVPAVAIAEYVPGLTLHDQLKAGPLPPAEAVTMIARAAEALQALHAAGAVHGAVSPRSLVVAPSVARAAPVLAQLVAPASGAYSTPERLEGGGPTSENDVWALYATLYAALTGTLAFDGTSKEELALAMREQRRKSLADCGIDRPELEALISDGLAGSIERRRSSVADLISGLYGWTKNRDASMAEAAELARLSMDWEGDEPDDNGKPKPKDAPKAPTVSVEYAIFDDEAAEDQTTVFLRPAAILETLGKRAPVLESTEGLFDPPPKPTLAPGLLPDPPPQPELPRELLPDPPPQNELGPALATALEPQPANTPQSKPPPLPERPRQPLTEKPRHPNKRRVAEEAALEALRSERPPLDDEAPPVIPMFPLEALYAGERPIEGGEAQPPGLEVSTEAKLEAPTEPKLEASTEPKLEASADAKSEAQLEPADTAPSKRDTGMASRAPPKPRAQGESSAPEAPLVSPKIDVSTKTHSRIDSKPWHDLTQPSKARRAERAAKASSAKSTPPVPHALPQSNPWAWIAGILGALVLVGITALELERRSVKAPPIVVTSEPTGTASTPPASSESDAAPPPLDAVAASGQAVAADGGPGAIAPSELGACVASYFPAGTFTGTEDFNFLCAAADFRVVTSQLHQRLVVAAGGKVTEAMREWATLGWYELGAAAMVRIRCCKGAAPIDLPKYPGRCEALPAALDALAREPLLPADVPARSQALATSIRCLYLYGIPRPYHYGIQPSGANRLVFEGFLSRAAARDH